MRFPQELVDTFINCLHDHEERLNPGPATPNSAFDALLACSLVSKSFGFPAHRHLFSSICFDPYPFVHHRGYSKDVSGLSQVLVRIRSLDTLLNDPQSNLKSSIASVSLAVDDNPVLFDDLSPFRSEIDKLLSGLPSLTSLSLNATTTAMLPWSEMGEKTVEMLERLCRSTTLRHISLTKIADVPTALILQSSVTSMRLEKAVFAQLSSSDDEKMITPLRKLDIYSYLREFWPWFSNVDSAWSQIETFSIGFWTPSDIGFFPDMLKEIPNTLKDLRLSLSGITNFEQCVETLSLHASRLIHLQDFSIILALGDRFFPAPITDIHPRGWLTALSDINLPPQIRHVAFTVEVRIAQDDLFRFQNLLSVNDQQGKIDISLLHRERFPNLKQLTIHVDITIHIIIRHLPSATVLGNLKEVRSNIREKMKSLLVIPHKDVVRIVCTSNPTSPRLRSFFQN